MTEYNYVSTAFKSTTVTHCCVGNFTARGDRNLILVKGNRLEIYKISPQAELELMLNKSICGRIAILELFRPRERNGDLLLVITERNEICILEWNPAQSEVVAINDKLKDGSGLTDRLTVNGQSGTVDPDGKLIGLHPYSGVFTVVTLDSKGKPIQKFNIGVQVPKVLDIKFLFGYRTPTIGVLYKDNEDIRHFKSYEIAVKRQGLVECNWYQNNVGDWAHFLIPVHPPLCGVLIVGEETIVYSKGSAFKAINFKSSITTAYGRFHSASDANALSYVLGDQNGLLHLLVITHENEKVTGLEILLLGETSVASSITYLIEDVIFLGSIYEDSQIIKLERQADTKDYCVKVLERYANLGPIHDFCVVEMEGQEKSRVVTCSGGYKDTSLRIVNYGTEISELASSELEGITGMWSLRSAADNTHNSVLVVGLTTMTLILGMKTENVLVRIKTRGFLVNVPTLVCHDAVFNQYVQVTNKTVRLVSSTTRELRAVWNAPKDCSINVVTANATQVLLATHDILHYLQIGDGVLTEVQDAQLEFEISCLNINPIGNNPDHSKLAAVGTWTEKSVGIYCLPDLNLITKQNLGGDTISRSVLLCSFEGISYLLCGLGDGHLLSFILSDDQLVLMKKVTLGTRPFTLHIYSSNNATNVFAASDRPTVIYSRGNTLVYRKVNLQEASCVCPFNSAAFPGRLAIGGDGKLIIGEITETPKISCISLGEHVRHICHQERTQTFAICSFQYEQKDVYQKHFVRLLDDKTFDFLNTYDLGWGESGCSILSCCFSGDNSVYYCVGTGYIKRGVTEHSPTRGRILVFSVQDQKLHLIAEEYTRGGGVYSLNVFNGKLIAIVNHKIHLYKWNGPTSGLEFEGAIESEDQASAIEIRDSFYLCADNRNSVTVLKMIEKNRFGRVENDRYDRVSSYHFGDLVTQFRHGYLAKPFTTSGVGHVSQVVFGTANGVIGIVASIPRELYVLLEELQGHMGKLVKTTGDLSYDRWRSFYVGREMVRSVNFLDGDLIESFLDLSGVQIDQFIKMIKGKMTKKEKEARDKVKKWKEVVKILATMH